MILMRELSDGLFNYVARPGMVGEDSFLLIPNHPETSLKSETDPVG